MRIITRLAHLLAVPLAAALACTLLAVTGVAATAGAAAAVPGVKVPGKPDCFRYGFLHLKKDCTGQDLYEDIWILTKSGKREQLIAAASATLGPYATESNGAGAGLQYVLGTFDTIDYECAREVILGFVYETTESKASVAGLQGVMGPAFKLAAKAFKGTAVAMPVGVWLKTMSKGAGSAMRAAQNKKLELLANAYGSDLYSCDEAI